MVFKLIGSILIVVCFLCGIYNIVDLTIDYYKFDIITNIERVTPDNVTFPAITFCADIYRVRFFRNQTFIEEDEEFIDNKFGLKSFLHEAVFDDRYDLEPSLSFDKNQLEYFVIPYESELCFRLNGATNEQVGIITANSSFDVLYITMKNEYREVISEDEYFIYRLRDNVFEVYVDDNYLNSYLRSSPILFTLGKVYEIKIFKSEIEEKLPEPYNFCQESTTELYHQMNCIEGCIYREIGSKYDCTLNGLFQMNDMKECWHLNASFIDCIKASKKACEKECPTACHSMKFTTSNSILYDSNNNYSQFAFSISDFSSLKITQIPKTTPFSFISSVGGTVGIFMGMTLLNFIEMFQFLFEIVVVIFCKK